MQKIRLYCITCKRTDIGYEEQAQAACRGGADAVEFAGEELTPRAFVAEGQKIKEICRASNALFFVRGRADIAVAVDADGVHLTPDDISIESVRQILGPRKLVGIFVSSLGQALAAAEAGASFLLVGPVFMSSTGAEPSCGVDIIRLIKKRVKIPVLAAGGITPENAAEAIASGADGVAAAHSVCQAPSVQNAAHELKQKILLIEDARRGPVNE